MIICSLGTQGWEVRQAAREGKIEVVAEKIFPSG